MFSRDVAHILFKFVLMLQRSQHLFQLLAVVAADAALQAGIQQIAPLNQTDSALDSSYTWVCSPWPWQNPQKEG